MPEKKQIVINTAPILALIAATGNLDILKSLYDKVWVPFEVQKEISSSGIHRFGVSEFNHARFLHKERMPVTISPILLNSLDEGEYEKRKVKSEKRKVKSEKRKVKSEKRKVKSETMI
jgi:predicted nucleic acid-binding protein